MIFKTSHADYTLPTSNASSLTIEEILRINHIPHNAVSIYGQKKLSNTSEIIPALKKTLSELEELYSSLTIRPDRNIDYYSLGGKQSSISNSSDAVAEYSFSELGPNSELTHIELTQADCWEYIFSHVDDFLDSIELFTQAPIVVGISGGGDSNTLLRSLQQSTKTKKQR